MNAADLQKFCAAPDDIREGMRQPWSRGKYTYATNGHILLRVARLGDVPENERAPDAAWMIAKIEPPSYWMPVPPATMPPDVKCDECDGTGVIEGEGPDDDSIDCEWCGHTGMMRKRIGVAVADAFFDQGYLSMIQGWKIAPNGFKPAWIRSGNIIGLLMPMTRQ